MSASWNGGVRLRDADGKPGHYYVTVRREDGRYAFALGPFTQPRPGQTAHAQALGLVQRVRRYVTQNDWREGPWLLFGTTRIDLCGSPPQGKLNAALKGGR